VAALALLAGIGCSRTDDGEPTGHIVFFATGRSSSCRPEEEGERLEIDNEEFWDAVFSDGRALGRVQSLTLLVDDGGFRVRNLENGRTKVVRGQPPQDHFLSYDLAWALMGARLRS
jgi:hypothetical protein